jgi:DNA-binding NtrC family response regulator
MPKMDGVEVLPPLKKIKPEIPVVMISGQVTWILINTMRLGAFDYISKPDLNRLLNTVRNVGPQGLVFRKHTPQEKVSKIMRMVGRSELVVIIKYYRKKWLLQRLSIDYWRQRYWKELVAA